jgi:hypothetical protein
VRTPTHHLTGAAAALTITHYHPTMSTPAAIAFAATATLTAGGPLSPDIDNQPWWKRLDRWLPDEALGNGGPLGHRRLTHWWGLPAVLAAATLTGLIPGPLAPITLGAAVGWGSHIAGDLIFGRGNPRVGLARGVPLLPWWGHIGVGLKADGWTERTLGALLVPAVGWLALIATVGALTP